MVLLPTLLMGIIAHSLLSDTGQQSLFTCTERMEHGVGNLLFAEMEMKKRVTVTLEVESDDELNMDDKFIKHDLEQEISCTTNLYEVISIETEVTE